MSGVETRHIDRDSLLVMAELRLDGQDETHKVKVRNLSTGGMMAEAQLSVLRGTRLSANLRNVGWVDGTVAWVQDSRFGIAFDHEVDPQQVRATTQMDKGGDTARYVRPAGFVPEHLKDRSQLRKL